MASSLAVFVCLAYVILGQSRSSTSSQRASLQRRATGDAGTLANLLLESALSNLRYSFPTSSGRHLHRPHSSIMMSNAGSSSNLERMTVQRKQVHAARRNILCFLPCSLFLTSPSMLSAESGSQSAQAGSQLAVEVVDFLDRYYYDRTSTGPDVKKWRDQIEKKGTMTDKEAIDLARKFIGTLSDGYTRILTADEAVKLSKFDVTGCGLNLGNDEQGILKVIQVPPRDSSAALAGVMRGDTVLSINGKPTKKMLALESLGLILEREDKVDMEISPVSGDGDETRKVVLERRLGKVSTDPVEYKLYDGKEKGQKIGYIRLQAFNDQAKERMRVAVRELEASGATDLVLDLRMNGGGNIESGIGITGFFVEKPLVLFVETSNGERAGLYSNESVLSKLPMQVWVDRFTASAAEFVAGALRDNCRAEIAGGRTYGKGLVQGVFGLSDGGVLVATVAKYTTPRGEDLNTRGLVPDVQRNFLSGFLGPSFKMITEMDVKATNFKDHLDTKACLEQILVDSKPSTPLQR